MIDRITGAILQRGPMDVVIDVHGVGLRVDVPLSTSEALAARPEGAVTTLLTHMHIVVNDPAVKLFGFATEEERRLFKMLLPIKGVGPSTALRILSSARSPAEVVAAIGSGDPKRIKAKGVGPKLAERVALELRDKLDGFAASLTASGRTARALVAAAVKDPAANDAYLALRGLEFDEAEARSLIDKVRARFPQAGVDELVRESLRSAS